MQTIIIHESSNKDTAPSMSWAVIPMGLSQSAMLVFLPLLVTHTDLGYAEWGQLFAMGMLTYLMGALVWPMLLPKLGHRRILNLGLSGFAISMLLFEGVLWLQYQDVLGKEASFTGLMLSRLLYGVFASSLLPVTQSWCGLTSSPEQRLTAFSRISQQLALSRALGPIVAAAAGWLHWLLLPALLALLPLYLMTMLARAEEPTLADTSSAMRKNPLTLLPPPWLGLIAIATTAFASSLQFQLSPALENLVHTDPQRISLILAGLMTAAAALSVLGHRLQIRYPTAAPHWRQLWIAALLATASLGLLFNASLWMLCTMALLMSLGLAWLTPLYSTQLSLRQAPGRQHLAAAQLGLTHILGHVAGLTVTAVAIGQSLQCVYIWMAMLGTIIAIASLSRQEDA